MKKCVNKRKFVSKNNAFVTVHVGLKNLLLTTQQVCTKFTKYFETLHFYTKTDVLRIYWKSFTDCLVPLS